MDYLLEGSGLISVRGRDVSLRLLDRPKVDARATFFQTLNTVAPIALVLVLHTLYRRMRKRKFGRPQSEL